MSDFDRVEEARERNEGLYYEEYHERRSGLEEEEEEFGEPGWCPKCSREMTPFGNDLCPKCGTPLEELGTGDDAPYPEVEDE